jgi:protein-S-isoprenylcysteine O-methyltransferase Ste14
LPPSADRAREPAARVALLNRAVVLAAAVATILVFLAVDSHSHSVSDTFYGMVVPEAIIVTIAAGGLLLLRMRRRVAR